MEAIAWQPCRVKRTMKDINAGCCALNMMMLSETLEEAETDSAIVLEMPNAQIAGYLTLLDACSATPHLKARFHFSINRNDELDRGQIVVWEVNKGFTRKLARLSNLAISCWNQQ